MTAQQDPVLLRQVFSNFDATNERLMVRSPEEMQERTDILKLFRRLEACAAENNNEEFRTLVDFDRHLKRIDLTGNLRGWTDFDKRLARAEIKNSADVEPFWSKITLAGIVTPNDDRDSRIVYAYCWDLKSDEQIECRFWIGREDNSWKLYDWARLDLGLSESQSGGSTSNSSKSPQMEGLQCWGQLMGEIDAATSENDRPTAKEKLRTAESQLVPAGFEGYRWVLTGHRWLALGEISEAERCYKSVERPDETPGAYYGLMDLRSRAKPFRGLEVRPAV